MTGRRALTVVVLLGAAGAAAALLALRATWVVEVVPRPAPFPAERVERTGGDLRSWLPALGWVALAGAGALVATRGAGRRVVAGLLAVAGLGIVAGAGTALTGPGVSAGGPVLAAAGGLAVAAAGGWAGLRGRGWPALGARYERTGRAGTTVATRSRPAEPHPDPADPAAVWEALDRGEDPTAR